MEGALLTFGAFLAFETRKVRTKIISFFGTRRLPSFQTHFLCVCVCVCVCVCSNSRNGVPRVAQRYGTIAAHTRRRASVLVVFVVFCVHMHSFAGLIRRTPPPTFSELQSPTATLIPLFSSSELTGCGYPDLFDRKNRLDMCPRWESNPRLSACKASTLSTRPGSSPNTFCILQNLLHCTVICC